VPYPTDQSTPATIPKHTFGRKVGFSWALVETAQRFPRRGGRVLGVHGAGRVQGPPSPAVTRVGLILPYKYGRIVCMKKTLHIDEVLLRDARSASRAKTDTDTVRLGLEALIRQAAYQRLRALRGTEPGARDVPRRRERAASTAHSAA
jgi:hypothetical protein